LTLSTPWVMSRFDPSHAVGPSHASAHLMPSARLTLRPISCRRPGGPSEGRRPGPVPYGTPFWAILRRFAQDMQKPCPTGYRSATPLDDRRARRNPQLRTSQLERAGRHCPPRPRGPSEGRRPNPVPCGTPFWAILRRFAQDMQKPCPTGYRSATPLRDRRARLQGKRLLGGLTPKRGEGGIFTAR